MIEPTRPGDEVPEPDLIAQRTPIEDTGTDGAGRLFPTPMAAAWEADEADQLEQAIIVPLPEEDDHDPGLAPPPAVSAGGEVFRQEVTHIGGGLRWGWNPADGRHPGGEGAAVVEGLDAATAVAALHPTGCCGPVVPAAVTITGQQQAFQ